VAPRALRDLVRALDARAPGEEQSALDLDDASLAAAICTLARERHRRRLLVSALTSVGRRLIDPLADILETSIGGGAPLRLARLREVVLAHVGNTALTQETRQILGDDLRKLLDDAYLAMLADHEERVQRPKVEALAHQVFRVVGGVFGEALARIPEHAARIAHDVVADAGARPPVDALRRRIVDELEGYFFEQTHVSLEADVTSLFAAQPGLVAARPPALERGAFRETAEACWDVLAELEPDDP
jgi:hypothetical protein